MQIRRDLSGLLPSQQVRPTANLGLASHGLAAGPYERSALVRKSSICKAYLLVLQIFDLFRCFACLTKLAASLWLARGLANLRTCCKSSLPIFDWHCSRCKPLACKAYGLQIFDLQQNLRFCKARPKSFAIARANLRCKAKLCAALTKSQPSYARTQQS